MNLINYRPKSVFNAMFDEFFGNGLADIMGHDHKFSMPSVNISEQDESFTVEVAAPGLKREDFSIEIDSDQLIISAKQEDSNETETKGKITRKEFNYTSFTRRFHLPDTLESDNIEASYTDGILKLVLPKKEDAKTKAPRTIEIK